MQLTLFKTNFWITLTVAVLLVFCLGIIDLVTGFELSFQFFYFIPLSILAINDRINKTGLVAFSSIVALVWLLADIFSGHLYSHVFFIYWNTFSRLVVFTTFSISLNTILKKNNEIKFINKELSKNNELVADSIKYARIIQDAAIPDFVNWNKLYPDSFILSLPKNVLSGDFFWYHEGKDTSIFGVIDCTGHGIPGSLLSMAGNSMLNKIVIENEITSPDKILSALQKEFSVLFGKSKEKVYDGMEVCMVSFNPGSRELSISQTIKSSLLILPGGEIIKSKVSSGTIGKEVFNKNGTGFENNTYCVQKGTVLYLFSDGFQDQFGGEIKKKFYFSRFEQLLLDLSAKETEEQKRMLQATFLDWKGTYPQTDDITVLGIKL